MLSSWIQLYPIWIISCQIQSFNGVPQCAHHSGTTVPEETMARGAEQSQAGVETGSCLYRRSNPDIIPRFESACCAHKYRNIYSPWCRISRHTVVIGIYLIIRVDPKCHLAPVFADLLDWLQTNDSKNVLFQIEGHSVSSLSSKNMYDHFLPLVRKHQTNKTRSSNTFCDVKF